MPEPHTWPVFPSSPLALVTVMVQGFFLRNIFSYRDLRNNEISWAIEDANEAFVGLSRLDKLYVLQIRGTTALPRHAERAVAKY